jgi:predicted TIM-barrel fold metal-dependent hydrolase
MTAIGGDRREYACKLMTTYNEWCIRKSKMTDRLRPVALLQAETPEDLLDKAKYLVANGIRVIQLRSASPPGNRSPAHPDLDPFWRYLADAKIPVVLHLGGETGFLKSYEWRNAPFFDGYRQGEEVRLDPWTTSTFHLACQNFTATMVLGGVFERHPHLAFGCVEVGASWLGPLSQHLDIWYANRMAFGYGIDTVYLPIKPSEYMQRNVRVSAFPFEPVDVYIEQFGLDNCYCYSSDWPHPEGGRNPMGDMANRLERLGPEIMEKYFVRNGELLMPQ